MSKFCVMPGICHELAADFSATDTKLAVKNESKIIEALSSEADKFTYLVINNGVSCEYIRVSAVDGCLVADERGVDWTTASNWFKGAKVSFELIGPALDAYMECRAEDAASEGTEDEPAKLPGYTSEYDEELGQWCYVADDGNQTCVFSVGKFRYTFKDGKMSKEARDPSELPRPGKYENATVVIDDKSCEVSHVEEGNKILGNSGCSCKCGCQCDKETDTDEDN